MWKTASDVRSIPKWLILILVWGGAAFASLPVVFHWAARAPRISRSTLALELGYALAALICIWIYRVESRV